MNTHLTDILPVFILLNIMLARIWNLEVAGASLLLVMSKPRQKLVWCSTLAATFISEINPSVFLIDDECICIFVICLKANIEVVFKLFCWTTIWVMRLANMMVLICSQISCLFVADYM